MNNLRKLGAAFLAVALTWTSAAMADEPGQAELRLRAGSVRLGEVAVTNAVTPGESSATRQVIQFAGPLTRAQRSALRAAGVRLGDYLPEHAYIMDVTGADLHEVKALPFVLHVSPLRGEWRLDPSLVTLHKAAARLRSRTPKVVDQSTVDAFQATAVSIMTFGDTTPLAVVNDLAGIDGVIVESVSAGLDRTYVDALVPNERLMDVAMAPSVQFVEPSPQGQLRNDVTTAVVQSGTDVDTPVWAAGLHGENQIIGLIDSTPRESSCYFDDTEPIGPTHRKFVAFRPTSPPANHYHGTFVAGVLAGDNAPYEEPNGKDGIAYAARISYSDYFAVNSSPSTFIDRLVDAHTDGARVHNNSWGDDTTTAYTIWSRQADEFSYYYEEDLVCFAVSNNGYLRTPENAKNILAVSASNQYPSHNTRCIGGQGPTADGRRKPDLMAPGCGVYSADVNSACGTRSGTGTSYACPVATASAVLVRQYYTEGYFPYGLARAEDETTPSGALIKATVLNSTVDMTGVSGYPSNYEGWGRPVLDRALYFAGDTRRTTLRDIRNAEGLYTAEAYSFPVRVFDDGEDLRVTMVFTDPPAAVNASDPVINDLDLTVTDPQGTVYRGNVLSGGWSVSGGTADPINNVEQVLIESPLPGRYIVEVAGTAVNSAEPQGFAVVASGGVLPDEVMGDVNADGDRDLADFATLQRCVAMPPYSVGDPCTFFDVDADGDVDLTDFAALASQLTGPAGAN